MDVLRQLGAFLRERNVQAYLVGGWVRDRLLGRPDVRDIDVIVPGQAISLARAFADNLRGAFYLMDAEHGVARVLLGKTYVDFADLRGDVMADLATRDLTINAMAHPLNDRALQNGKPADLAQDLIDPFHGWDDLKLHRIRAVSDAVFQNDPVRLLRALRVASGLAFRIDPDTEQLMRRDAARLADASMERARDELFRILADGNVVKLLRQMDELGLLAALLPEVTALKGVVQSPPHIYDVFEHSIQAVNELVGIQEDDYKDVAGDDFVPELSAHFARILSGERTRGIVLRLVVLLHDIGKSATTLVDPKGRIHFYQHETLGAEMADSIARRLRLSNAEFAIFTRAIEAHLRPPQLARAARITNRAIYHFFRDTRDVGIDVCVLALADTRAKATMDPAQDADLRSMLTRLLEAYYRFPETAVSPPRLIDGNALMQELGLSAGPHVGEVLEAIREAQVEGRVSTRAEALALARGIMRDERKTNVDEGRMTSDDEGRRTNDE